MLATALLVPVSRAAAERTQAMPAVAPVSCQAPAKLSGQADHLGSAKPSRLHEPNGGSAALGGERLIPCRRSPPR